MAAANYFDQVQKIYIAFYQRPADSAGLVYWANRIEAEGGSINAVVSSFANSPEANTLYGTIDATTIGSVIDQIYMALFNRAPDAAGKQFYMDGFAAGTFTPGQIALDVLNGASGDDSVAVLNKVQVANNFTQVVDGRPLSDAYFGTGNSFSAKYDGDADAQAARDMLKAVTSSPATVLNPSQVTEFIKTNIADAGDAILGQTGGQSFTLTTGADTGAAFTGTTGADVFNALAVKADGTAASTLTAFDAIDGGAGTDTLNIYTTAVENAAFPAATVKNIEIVNVYNSGAAAAFGDASKFVGVQQLWQIGAAEAVTNLEGTTTAGFRNVNASVNVSPAAGVAISAIALDNFGEGKIVTVNGSAATSALSAVTVSGTVKDTDANGVIAATVLDTYAGKNVETFSVKSDVATSLSVTKNAASTKEVSSVDASASTGAITFVGATTVANIMTGTGKDTVTLATSLNATTKTASVSTGDGDDTITVAAVVGTVAAGQKVTVDAGAGKDNITVTVDAGVAYDVMAGAGDDTVVVNGVVKTTDKIDGGDGVDTISLAGKINYLADDYIVANKVLTNFETLKLTGAAVTNLDASKLAANYTTIDLSTGSVVDNVSTQALVANGALTAEAAGYKSALEAASPGNVGTIVYAGTLNITDKGLAGAADAIRAHAETVNLTIAGGKANGVAANNATLTGEAKTATVTLSAGTDTKSTVTDTSDDTLVASTVTISQTAAATAEGLSALTSLTLSGNGKAIVGNAALVADYSLVTVDAFALNSVNEKGVAVAGLQYTSFNSKAETITLGGGLDTVTLNASTYGKVDTITGLNLVLNAGKTALDVTKSDTLVITGFGDLLAAGKMTTTQTDLDLALKDAAAFTVSGSAVDMVAFHFGGDTYLFSDKGTMGSIDAADIVVKLTGTIDLDALVLAV